MKRILMMSLMLLLLSTLTLAQLSTSSLIGTVSTTDGVLPEQPLQSRIIKQAKK